jgi:diguanylate cyclase (GGDEF)-like protein/PAS domain S-box-containing protein
LPALPQRLRDRAGLALPALLTAWPAYAQAHAQTQHWLGSVTVVGPLALAGAGLSGVAGWALWRLLGRHTSPHSPQDELCATLLDHSQQLIGLLDLEGRVLRLNKTAAQWMGLVGTGWQGQPVQDLPALSRDRTAVRHLREAVERARAGHTSRVEISFDDALGHRRLCEVDLRPVSLPGQAGYLLLEARDISLQRQVEAKLKLAAAVFEQAREGIVIIDAAGSIVSVNQAFSHITGLVMAAVHGMPATRLPLHDGEPRLGARVRQGLQSSGHWQGELRGQHPSGQRFTVWASISQRLDSSAQLTHLIGILSDVTQTRDAEHRLQHQASFDALTQLPNRRLLGDRLQLAITAARRSASSLAVLHLDLNRFRLINDSFGRGVGDQVLQDTATQIRAALRDADGVARLGADEFAVLLPATDREGAERVARKLLDFVAHPRQVAGHEYSMTAAVGVAMFPDDGNEPDLLLRHAEAAMHRAKQRGQNACEFFTAGMQEPSVRRLTLESALRRATERGELLLHYQPQLDMSTGALTGLEALVRWQHPELGMVSPGEFIPLAESNGQILDIGAWVLREAVTQLKTWMDAGMAPTVVAVNLSAVQFRDPHLPELVRSVLQLSGLPPQCLELELTESVATGQPAAAIAMMQRLHDLGVRLSIDDFGTGYSSLNYLKRFPIHTLKIDQSFVRDISSDADDRAIVLAIVQLAKALSLTTIAEGVETPEQASFLQLQGCDVVQGFLYSRPLPPPALVAWLQARGQALQVDVPASPMPAHTAAVGNAV